MLVCLGKHFFDIVTTYNDEICYVKHVLDPFCVFFTLFGCCGGGGGYQGGYWLFFVGGQGWGGGGQNFFEYCGRCALIWTQALNNSYLVQALTNGRVPGPNSICPPLWAHASEDFAIFKLRCVALEITSQRLLDLSQGRPAKRGKRYIPPFWAYPCTYLKGLNFLFNLM